MIYELTPPDQRKLGANQEMPLKDIWKWIQNLLKEYMKLKKNNHNSENNDKPATTERYVQSESDK